MRGRWLNPIGTRSESGAPGREADPDGFDVGEKDQLRPHILFSDVIEDVTDAHAIIIHRNRSGSMIIAGDALGVSELTPGLFAAVAANQAGRAAPGVTLDDVSMIGESSRIDVSGHTGAGPVGPDRPGRDR